MAKFSWLLISTVARSIAHKLKPVTVIDVPLLGEALDFHSASLQPVV